MYKTPTFAGYGRSDWYTALLILFFFWERLIPGLEFVTCCFWWKVLAIAYLILFLKKSVTSYIAEEPNVR